MVARIAAFLGTLALVAGAAIPDSAATAIIEKDVVILGGGASGAHAAVRLREDLNKTVVIVEKQNRLGGHVATFNDPETGNPYDYGVNSYTNYTDAREFFARFNIPVEAPSRLALTTTYADFITRKATNYSLPASAEITAALRTYLELCEKYEDIIIPSYVNFPNDTADIPEDLTLKFSDFVEKYGIQAAVPRIFQVTALGMGNLADQTTLYVMQAFGAPLTRFFLGTVTSFVPVFKRNKDIYDAIAELLVRGADEQLTFIRAKNRQPRRHRHRRGRWQWSTVYAGIAYHPSLSKDYSFTNTVPANWLALPNTPFVGRFDYLGDNNFRVLVTGEPGFDSAGAQELVVGSLERLAAAGTIPSLGAESPVIKAWADHGAMSLRASASDLEAGHITKQYVLQGRKSTYFTGRAWAAQFTTLLWAYNDQHLLPKLLAGF